MTAPPTKPCPQCGTPAATRREANKWRPFCSERCRNLDLAAWLDGDYAIPGEKVDERVIRFDEE